MKIDDLRKRWNQYKVEQIIHSLKNNLSLASLVDTVDGRWDLRGINLTKPVLNNSIFGNYSIEENGNLLEFKKVILTNIDFSYCDMSYTLWLDCNFENILMTNTNVSNVRMWACSFNNSLFDKVNFRNSLLGGRLKSNSGSFENVVFRNSDFRKTVYSFPLFNKCIFEECNLDEVNFDGSRFEDCKFIGKIFSTIFRGTTTDTGRHAFWHKKINPDKFPNQMKNIDFSGSLPIGVSFINNVDLSTCKFPTSDTLLFINDVKRVYSNALQIISMEWNGENRKIADSIINGVYLTTHHNNQKQGIIDKIFLTQYIGEIFGEKFFTLIKTINEG